MTLETTKFDLVYGRLLKLGVNIENAKLLAKTLIDISNETGLSIEQVMKNVDSNGMRFDNEVYEQLNKARTNSSQIGYLDRTNIPPSILQQVV